MQTPCGDIHCTRQGAGDPVAMLLPQSTGPVGIDPFCAALARRFSVIRYDQLGTGQSAPLSGAQGLAMEAQAQELAGLLAALGLARVHLFCHSTGCGIGIALAAARPDLVGGLVLAAPWSHADGHLTTLQNLRVAAARALGPSDYATFNASLLYPPDYRRAQQDGFARMIQSAAPPDADTIAARLAAILDFDARAMAPGIACPALVVTGADDQLMPPWHGRHLAETIPGARLLVLDGGGHMLPETRTADLAEAVVAFLDAV